MEDEIASKARILSPRLLIWGPQPPEAALSLTGVSHSVPALHDHREEQRWQLFRASACVLRWDSYPEWRRHEGWGQCACLSLFSVSKSSKLILIFWNKIWYQIADMQCILCCVFSTKQIYSSSDSLSNSWQLWNSSTLLWVLLTLGRWGLWERCPELLHLPSGKC